jgi:hypothetical protein
MAPSLLAVVGMPGGTEMVLVFFVLFLLFGVPATLLVALGYKHVQESAAASRDDRLDELEAEVEALRSRLEGDEE